MGRSAVRPPPVEEKSREAFAYGAHLAQCLGLVKDPPMHVHRRLSRGVLAASDLKSRTALSDPSDPLGYDDAYTVVVRLRPVRRQVWFGGRFASDDIVEGGRTCLIDLRREPQVLLHGPWHNVQFYVPISAMKACAEQNELPSFTDIAHPPLAEHDDPVMRHVAGAALSALAHPYRTSGLLLDAMLDAVCIHVAGRYGALQGRALYRSSGLAPWQERRAKELMDSRLDVSMWELAQECGLSVAHFGRAFKRSTGTTPHQWQLARRMRRAQALLKHSTLPIASIALECGFSSQSHFTTAFTETTGITPGRWRRSDHVG